MLEIGQKVRITTDDEGSYVGQVGEVVHVTSATIKKDGTPTKLPPRPYLVSIQRSILVIDRWYNEGELEVVS
jgi:RNase P/RNase MRP subunit p29